MPHIYACPRHPSQRPYRVTSLKDVLHESQKESVALALNLPYTPPQDRHRRCLVSESLDMQVSVNQALQKEER